MGDSSESTEAVKLRLFGREFAVRGHGNRQYVEELAAFIERRADEIQSSSRVTATVDLVILTLLNIADEMFQSKQAQEKTIRALEEKTEKLIGAIDRTV
ncbi:cell division protein ZapA [Thermodesulfobacteriota bacterium]